MMADVSPSRSPNPGSRDKDVNGERDDTSRSQNGSEKSRSPARSELSSRTRSISPSSSGRRGIRGPPLASRDTNSTDQKSVRCRVFVGNLNTDKIGQDELVEHFSQYGKVFGCSLHMNYGFVQYGSEADADKAVEATHGSSLFGKRVDANIASERRKPQNKERREGKPPFAKGDEPRGRVRRRSRSRSPGRYRSRSPMSRYDELYRRDDPLGRGDRPPPRDYYDDRSFVGRDPYARPVEPYPPGPKTGDCEIIATSGDLKVYGESIQTRLRAMGISANVMFPPPEVSILEIVDRISRSGSLYAVVITTQNMYHKSCTLNVLHGSPQEHRNMPLDDALAFVARNFNQYLNDSRDRKPWQAPTTFPSRGDPMGKTILTQDSYISGLLTGAAAGRPLKVVEVNHLIEALIKYKNEIDNPDGKEASSQPIEDRPALGLGAQPLANESPAASLGASKDSQPAQAYYNPQSQQQSTAYNYGASSSALASTYLGYLGYGSTASTAAQSSATTYASTQSAAQQATPASAYGTQQATQQMSSYPNYYAAS